MGSLFHQRGGGRAERRLARPALWLAAGALTLLAASCDQAQNQRAKADANDAAAQAGAGLNQVASETKNTVDDLAVAAKPTVDRAVHDAKTGVNTLAIAAGKATVKAGATLEHAGERARQNDTTGSTSENGTN